MEKTACPDKESILFFTPKADASAAIVVAVVRRGDGVPVYAPSSRFGIAAAFPKERRVRTVIRIFPITAQKHQPEKKRFTGAYYDAAVVPNQKPALLFAEPA